MVRTKKVILFIVEGITDRISLEAIIQQLNDDDEIDFQITCGDITSAGTSTTDNIVNKVYRFVKKFMDVSNVSKTDIVKIVQIFDTDGAFVDENCIKFNEVSRIKYCEDKIETKNVKQIQSRNRKKAELMRVLINTSSINGIPYEAFYFSTNLEHVLHNVQNPSDKSKMEFAEAIEDRYYDRPQAFIAFLQTHKIEPRGDYKDTWDYIQEGCNSLKRRSNFGLYFKE